MCSTSATFRSILVRTSLFMIPPLVVRRSSAVWSNGFRQLVQTAPLLKQHSSGDRHRNARRHQTRTSFDDRNQKACSANEHGPRSVRSGLTITRPIGTRSRDMRDSAIFFLIDARSRSAGVLRPCRPATGKGLLTWLRQRTGVDRRHVSRCPIRLEDFRCDFLSVHRHASRRFDPDPYLVASNVEDPHDDVRADHDRLVGTTAQDEHGSPPGLARDRFAGGVFGVSEHHLAPDTRSFVYHQRTEKIRRDRGDTAVLGVPDRDEHKHSASAASLISSAAMSPSGTSMS